MENDDPKHVMVTLTVGLAAKSLAAAHHAGMSRSELVRRLLSAYLEQEH
jgi:metal-responsive CopG/Arc/MetJ family transcriptional regulator